MKMNINLLPERTLFWTKETPVRSVSRYFKDVIFINTKALNIDIKHDNYARIQNVDTDAYATKTQRAFLQLK